MRTMLFTSPSQRVAIFLLLITGALASCGNQKTGEVFQTKNGAIDGYDPVAYFKAQKPMKGTDDLVYEWNNAHWHFSSEENLNEFKQHPEQFAPQFGGYCAYGTSQGHKAPTEPDAWTIADGKLYLNYNADVMKMWRADQSNLIEKANVNWPKVMKMD